MATVVDSYTTGDDDWQSLGTTLWRGQTFTASKDYDLYSIKVRAYNSGTPGTVTAYIYAVDGSSPEKPTGAAIASGTANGNDWTPDGWFEVVMDTPVSLTNGVMYAWIISSAVSAIYLRRDQSTPTYAGGHSLFSSNA